MVELIAQHATGLFAQLTPCKLDHQLIQPFVHNFLQKTLDLDSEFKAFIEM